MKRDVKNFTLGFIIACLMITPVIAFADAIQVSLNTVNINLNGVQVAAKGQSYILADGSTIPYSLNYNGTVYLPIRKVSELVGKDIGYDGKSSTISISDKDAATVVLPPIVPDTATESAIVENQDIEENPTDNSSNTSDPTTAESGFAVINSFAKLLNSSGTQVNRLVGYIDGNQCDMLTSQKDLINYTKAAPILYEIKYSDKVITDMDLISSDKEDMVKTTSETGKIAGNNGTYSLASNVVFYEIMKNDDGSFNRYAVFVGTVKTGYKVYLYDTNGTSGYDIVFVDRP